ncbi:hypothetical protein DPMN_175710 [Dreissena polymorpha]|uniref:Uncharacterized protein n=1 Tax=Dreissena polymorpha TaxID=45954 RepID=A0A9D4E713_DREPO|nr:hypothetical protein DPMN_175710 [Dreissena polymorpha]
MCEDSVSEMGVCSADLTTPCQYGGVWSGYVTLITFILPFGVTFLVLCFIYVRSLGRLSERKHLNEQDVCYTNTLCTISIFTCILYMFYFVVMLSTANGVDNSPNLIFWSTYCLSVKTGVFYLTFAASVHSTAFNCVCGHCLLRSCCRRHTSAMAYEMSEIDLHSSLTIEHISYNT